MYKTDNMAYYKFSTTGHHYEYCNLPRHNEITSVLRIIIMAIKHSAKLEIWSANKPDLS